MEKTQPKGIQMAIRQVRKSPIGNIKSERLKVIFEGNHTLEEKACMFMRTMAFLENEHRIFHAGISDFWLAPIDEYGCPLTILPDGELVARTNLIIDSPYDCAADFYRAG